MQTSQLKKGEHYAYSTRSGIRRGALIDIEHDPYGGKHKAVFQVVNEDTGQPLPDDQRAKMAGRDILMLWSEHAAEHERRKAEKQERERMQRIHEDQLVAILGLYGIERSEIGYLYHGANFPVMIDVRHEANRTKVEIHLPDLIDLARKRYPLQMAEIAPQ